MVGCRRAERERDQEMTTADRAQLEATRRIAPATAQASGIQVGSVQWICQMEMSRPVPRPPMTDDPTDRGYWTGIELAPKLPILLRQLTSSFDDNGERFRNTKANLEQLPYSLGGMSYALFEFIRLQAEIVKIFAPKQGIRRWLPPDATDRLSYMLEAFFDHAYRTVLAVKPYLCERYSLDDGALDVSMLDVKMKKLLAKVPDLGVRNLSEEYWKNHGKTIKAYRDFAQHYAMLASDCAIFVDEEGTPVLYIAILKNPVKVKEEGAKPSYDPPEHALPYMCEVFYETIRFVNRLSLRLLDPSKPLNVASYGPNIRGRIGSSQQGDRIPSVCTIDAELRKLRAELAEEEGRGAA